MDFDQSSFYATNHISDQVILMLNTLLIWRSNSFNTPDAESVVLVGEGGIHLPILQWASERKRMPLGL